MFFDEYILGKNLAEMVLCIISGDKTLIGKYFDHANVLFLITFFATAFNIWPLEHWFLGTVNNCQVLTVGKQSEGHILSILSIVTFL